MIEVTPALPGRGALPRARPHAADRPRVLVVDDEPHALAIFSAFLSAAGMEAVGASSGERALQLLASETFDTILTDVTMPGMDGIALLGAARDRDADLPVILVTGRPEQGARAGALGLGAIDCLVKPVPGDLLVRTVSMSTRLCLLARAARLAESGPALRTGPRDGPGPAPAFRRALASLYLAWQPVVRARDGAPWGHEAFVRTLEPSLADPASLFGAAVRWDGLTELGRRVRRAARLELESLGGPAFLNVHPSELADDDLLDPASPLSGAAGSIVLELTDRTPLADAGAFRERIVALRRLGYRIGVDDVASGGPSLTRLALVQPDFVKLGASMVRGLDESPSKRRIASSMTRALHDLGMLVVATGIETGGEHEAAAAAGADLLQGFLFGRPKPVPRVQ